MTRVLDPAVATASGSPVIEVAIFVELDFVPDPLLLWSGLGTFVWNNRTFFGTGTLMTIGSAEETTETRAVSVAVGLSGVPTDLISAAENTGWRGQPANIWLALLNPQGGILGDPVLVMSGRLDVLSWKEGVTAEITMTIESRLADLERARVRRYTDRDQEDEYPGDLGFQYVESLQDTIIQWGKGVTT
jgi:hypothetical protein